MACLVRWRVGGCCVGNILSRRVCCFVFLWRVWERMGGGGAVLAGCLIAWLVCFLFGWCFRCSVAWHCVGRWVVWLNGRFVGFLRICLLDWLVACLVSCLPFLFVFVVCFVSWCVLKACPRSGLIRPFLLSGLSVCVVYVAMACRLNSWSM